MAPPEAATETTNPTVQGVEVNVQAGDGSLDHSNANDKAVGPNASLTHDVGVGMEEGELGKRGAEEGSLAVLEPPAGKRRRNAKPFRIHLTPLSALVGSAAEGGGGGGGAEGGGEGGGLQQGNLGGGGAVAGVGGNSASTHTAATQAMEDDNSGPGSALVMASLGERIAVDKPNGRYNKNGVCFHKARLHKLSVTHPQLFKEDLVSTLRKLKLPKKKPKTCPSPGHTPRMRLNTGVKTTPFRRHVESHLRFDSR
jgi:hypothetical protein